MHRQKSKFEKWAFYDGYMCFPSFWPMSAGNLGVHKDSSCLTNVN